MLTHHTQYQGMLLMMNFQDIDVQDLLYPSRKPHIIKNQHLFYILEASNLIMVNEDRQTKILSLEPINKNKPKKVLNV